jgi:predicted cupin superfamily sugar epimerase
MNSKDLIQQLLLQPHPEGGFYKETYRSDQMITLPGGKVRNVSTAIYYLLEDDNKSAFHRIQADELWFFHQGQTLEIVFIQDGKLKKTILGNTVEKGEIPQTTIPANVWFAARIKDAVGYALVSCTVAPGFDFLDFELAKRDNLVQQYPQLKDIIEEFT